MQRTDRKKTRRQAVPWQRRGAMIVLIAVMLTAFLITLAFSVDIAYMQVTRTELRTATDAAARAGAEALSRQLTFAEARRAVKDAAALNKVAGKGLEIDDADIFFGYSALQPNGSWQFSPGGNPTNAVRVFGRRTNGSLSGPVPLFFGGLLGTPQFEPTQAAVASQLDRDVCIVIDRSGSMAWDLSGIDNSYPPGGELCLPPHPTLSRWAAADAAVTVFLTEISLTPQDEQVSLVTYASAGTWCSNTYNAADIEIELTPNYSAVASAMAARGTVPIPGSTSISAGIDMGILALTNPATARTHAVKTMILLTDGIHNTGPVPITSTPAANTENITIHTITFSNGANQPDMQAVAAATNGNHYHAPTAAALQVIFKEIAATLPVVLTE
jgi:hypothetical protein